MWNYDVMYYIPNDTEWHRITILAENGTIAKDIAKVILGENVRITQVINNWIKPS